MNGELFRQALSRIKPEAGGEKKVVNPYVVWVLLAAILFLAFSSFSESDEKKTKAAEPQTNQEQTQTQERYREKLEERLKETLQKISGTGQVSVFIHMEDGGERILAADRSQSSQEDVEDGQEASRMEEESHVILWEQDGAEVPYIIKERLPEPIGVLVVAEGADDEKVRQEIYEAVRAIFGLPAHRIKITN